MIPTVLIVDDNEEILRSTAEYFRARKFTVVESSTPVGVTSLVSRHKPNLLILDLMMPSMNGEALIKLVKKTTAGGRVPTVFYSSADEEQLYRVSRGVEGSTYVQKSDGLDALFRKVQKCLSSRPE